MIEVTLSGVYVGDPYRVGGGGAVLRNAPYEELGRITRPVAAGELRSWSAVELATLTEALRKILDEGWRGEEILVRSGLGRLPDFCRGLMAQAPEDAFPWIDELRRLGAEFSQVRVVVAPRWVTLPAEDLALRAVIESAGGSSRETRDHVCPRCRDAADETPRKE